MRAYQLMMLLSAVWIAPHMPRRTGIALASFTAILSVIDILTH